MSVRARIAAAVRWGRDRLPLTGAGVVLLGASALALLVEGRVHQDVVLGLLGAVGLLALLVVVPAVWLAGFVWARALRRQDLRTLALEDGVRSPSGFEPPHLVWLPFVDVTCRWVTPEAEVDTTTRNERVTVHRRGEHANVTRRVEVRDVLGLAGVSFERTTVSSLVIRPSTGALDRVEAVAGMRGGDALPHPDGTPDGDPIDLRAYAPGDPIRMVLWKTYARARVLVVRAPERALSPWDETRAFLVVGEGDDAAAGALRVAARHAGLGARWTLAVDGVPGEAHDAASAEVLLVRSGGVPTSAGGADLARFLHAAARVPGQRVMVFVPCRPGPWLARVRDAVGGAGVSVDVLVGVDGLADPAPAARWWRRASPRRRPAAPRQAELFEVLRALAPVASRLVVVDRVAGRTWGAGALTRDKVSA